MDWEEHHRMLIIDVTVCPTAIIVHLLETYYVHSQVNI